MKRKLLLKPKVVFTDEWYLCYPPNGEYEIVELVDVLGGGMVSVRFPEVDVTCAKSEPSEPWPVPLTWIYTMPNQTVKYHE